MGILTELLAKKFNIDSNTRDDKLEAYKSILHDQDSDPRAKRYALEQLLHIGGYKGKESQGMHDVFSKLLGIHKDDQRKPMDEKPPAGNAYGDGSSAVGNVSAEGDAAAPAEGLPPMPARNGASGAPAAQAASATPAPATAAPPPPVQATPAPVGTAQPQPVTGTPIQPGAPPQWPERPQRSAYPQEVDPQQPQEADARKKKGQTKATGLPPAFFLTPEQIGERDFQKVKPLQEYLNRKASELEDQRHANARDEEMLKFEHSERLEMFKDQAKIAAAQARQGNLTGDMLKKWRTAEAELKSTGVPNPTAAQVEEKFEKNLVRDAEIDLQRRLDANKAKEITINVQRENLNEKLDAVRSVPDYVKGLFDGTLDPDLTGIPRQLKSQVEAAALQQGFNFAKRKLEFGAVKRKLATMNSSQQWRVRNSLESLQMAIPRLRTAYARWQHTKLPSNYKLYNKLALAAAMNGDDKEAAAAATDLNNIINGMVEGLANVYMGGNSPTDKTLDLGKTQLNSNWNQAVFSSALDRLEEGLHERQGILNSPAVAGIDNNSPYAPGVPAAPDADTEDTGDTEPQAKVYVDKKTGHRIQWDAQQKKWVDAPAKTK